MTLVEMPEGGQAIQAGNRPVKKTHAYLLVAICFLLSGFAALLYETVWLRQFAIILGTSEQALTVILAAYMGGLAIGSWIASKQVDSIRRPAWVYGWLEGGIALCAIAMPWGLGIVEQVQTQLFGGASEPPSAGSWSQTLFGLLSSFALIILPTAMMGATLPLLAKHVVHRDQHVGPRIGVLYGINTLGAVAGTLAAAFLLLPSLGLRRTTWVGAVINLGIFVLICFAVRLRAVPEAGSETANKVGVASEFEGDKRYRLVLFFAMVSGAIAFCYEIIFTRMLSHILGGSVYAFATMLAGFLLGIALGGTIGSRLAIRRDRSVVALAYTQSLAGLSALFAYHSIDVVAGWSLEDWGGPTATLSQVMVSILILLPTATFLGATFPLATRIYARDESEAATGSARVYFSSTLGGIGGALLTGILLLPSLAYEGSAFVAILVNAVLAIVIVGFMSARFYHGAAALVTLLMLVVFAPTVPNRVLRKSALTGKQVDGDLIFNRVGRSGTVTVFDQLGDSRFMTNGLPEALVAQRGSQDQYRDSATWLSALPPILRPDCESMLIIGLGGGVAVANTPPSVAEIDVFELEPIVIEANDAIRNRRNRDPLSDDRVQMILNDGRNGLAMTSKSYDAIVSQPSHPWTAGASHLYTREFAETVRRRLYSDGVFLQWMNTEFVNPELFRSLSSTLLDVFPHVRVYEPVDRNLLFVASMKPIRPEAVETPELSIDSRNRDYYRVLGIHSPTHLFALLRIDESELRSVANHSSLITDEYNLLAMRAPHLSASRNVESMTQFLQRHATYMLAPSILRERCPTLDPFIFGLRLWDRERTLPIDSIRALGGNAASELIYEAQIAKREGLTNRWEELLRTAAREHPNDPRAAFLLLAHTTLGTSQSLSEAEQQELLPRLNQRYEFLLEAVEAVSRNDLSSVQESEPTLASFGIDEIGYEMAVRLRILWRLADEGPAKIQHGRQALDLIAEASPVIGPDAFVSLRVLAAIRIEQQDIALATAVSYAKGVVEQITSGKVTDIRKLELMRSNLVRCHEMLTGPNSFPLRRTPRFQKTIEYLEKVIAGDI